MSDTLLFLCSYARCDEYKAFCYSLKPKQIALNNSKKYEQDMRKYIFGNSGVIFIMSSKRKSGNATTNINFRPQTESKKWETKGTRPLPNPVTVQEILITMVVQLCRKILFFNTKWRIGLYLAGVFLSFIFDVLPLPKSYFSRTDNLFNQYFVKIGWAWTLLMTLPFVFLTSFTYCCGNRKLISMHLLRLCVATVIWFVFTKTFVLIERSFGTCSRGKHFYKTKSSCLLEGYFWSSLDISGHVFILMWSTLVIIEEGRVISGWESIKDLIRNESHSRSINKVDHSSPVKNLTDDEFLILRSSYKKFSPYVKALFISMTLLSFIWDMMIVSTILYFHKMIEKLIAGIFAAAMWYITYNYWYVKLNYLPQQPGYGLFKYTREADKSKETSARIRSPQCNFNSRKSGQTSSFSTNIQGAKSQDTDRIVKDDMSLNHEQDFSKKFDKNKLDDSSVQFPLGLGVTTRSQALKNLKIDANKTI